MNVFKKLQAARQLVAELPLKKSGKNKFAGYEYFELGDFMPDVTRIFNETGLCGIIVFTASTAELTVYDADNNESCVTFSSPLVYAENSKGQAIQSLGSTHTYYRRYLWLLALDLVEPDAIDGMEQAEKPKATKPKVVERPAEPTPLTTDADMANMQLFSDKFIEFGAACVDVTELTNLWKANQGEIDRLKRYAPELFTHTVACFGDIKANLLSKVD